MGDLVMRGDVIKFPKFYIKAVGGKFSLEHRLTHTYLETYDTEKELVEGLKKWNKLSDKELWTDLLYKRHISIVKPADFEKRYAYEEDWYFGAWGIFTTQFFRKNKKLLVEVENIPTELILEIRAEKSRQDNEMHKRMMEERQVALQKLNEEEKQNSRKKKQPEDEISVSIGDGAKAEEVAKKKKVRAKAKLKIKRKKGASIKVPIVSDNPFD